MMAGSCASAAAKSTWRWGGRGSGESRRPLLEERPHRLGDGVVVVDDIEHLPAVEGGAGVRDAEGDHVADLERRADGQVQITVLVVHADADMARADRLRLVVQAGVKPPERDR